MGYAETFTLYARTVVSLDDDGNEVYSETEAPLVGGFAPAGSTEFAQGRDQVVTFDTLYLDEGQSPPAAGDQMLVRGVRREVEGVAGVFLNPFTGWTPGPVVRLKTVSG